MDPNQQVVRRRAVEAGGGGQNHPPPQPCPRCASNNTKFCYYNNYSLSQPRFFCKGCRRYWTQGGTLRNVPVGGGCRKSKRPKLASSTSPSSGTGSAQTQLPSLPPPSLLSQPLILNTHDQRLSMMTNNNIITSTTTSNNNNNNVGTMMMGHSFYGGGSPGFMSSLAAMQGMNNQPISFGPNLGLLHGFGLANYDPQQVQQQHHNQEVSLPSLYSTREVGSSSNPSMQEWNLRMGTGPGATVDPIPETNIVDNTTTNTDNNNDNNRNQDNGNNPSNQQWSNFMGTNGLDDP